MNILPQPQEATAQIAASRAAMVKWLEENSKGTAFANPPKGAKPPPGIQAQLLSLAITAMTESILGKSQVSSMSRTPVQLLSQAADTVLNPLGKAHPWVLVGASVLTGSALVLAKPWRWLLRPEIVGAIATQVVTRVLASVSANTLPTGTDTQTTTPRQS